MELRAVFEDAVESVKEDTENLAVCFAATANTFLIGISPDLTLDHANHTLNYVKASYHTVDWDGYH